MHAHNIRMASSSLTSASISKTVEKFGFVECSDITVFLRFFCEMAPGKGELIYIRHVLFRCLSAHDNGSAYFSALRSLVTKISSEIEKDGLPDSMNIPAIIGHYCHG